MAAITERKDKDGHVISYVIRVYRGYDETGKRIKPYTMTWKPAPDMTAKQIEKELKRQEVKYEEQCRLGYALDNKQTFSQYAEYVIGLKERTGTKHKTIELYKYLLERINIAIGHIKISDLKPQHLNLFYEQLSKDGIRKSGNNCVKKGDLKKAIKSQYSNREAFAKAAGVAINTIDNACKGLNIQREKAQQIAGALGVPLNKLFSESKDVAPLSNKTILEYHRFISMVLSQAEKEMLVEYNMARKATPPKYKQKAANYFQPEQIEDIRNALDEEPIKWKTLTHLLLITGARRGEIAALKWEAIDFKNSQIHICLNLEYSKDFGVYEDSLKTTESDRWVKLPAETMILLKEYRNWWLETRRQTGSKWHMFIEISDNKGVKQKQKNSFLFIQENTSNIGYPMNPDTITDWLGRFSKRHDLPHINPHAFRHTMASILYFNGIDSISISKRLGHAKVSTTTDIYSHIIKQADEQSAECIADAIFRSKKKA